MKLLLDEHISPVVSVQLRRRGHDAEGVAERPELRGMDDASLLEWAADDDRVFVTADHSTMPDAAEALRARRGGHGGVVFISARRFTLRRDNPGALIDALAALARTDDRDAYRDVITWL